MLEELPNLAQRIKEFVRNNPLEEGTRRADDLASRLKGCAVLTVKQLVEAAKASRWPIELEVANDTLTLAQVKAYENTINLFPIEYLPGIGQGLLRVAGFAVKKAFSIRCDTKPSMHAYVEYSPLGWPEMPDMVSADFNTLFRKPAVLSPEETAMVDRRELRPPESSGRREFL